MYVLYYNIFSTHIRPHLQGAATCKLHSVNKVRRNNTRIIVCCIRMKPNNIS